MKIKKSTLSIVLSLALFIGLSIAGLRISEQARLKNFINERNIICSNLSVELSADEGIDECFCYFEGFKTGNPAIDKQSLPLCACECLVNGTMVKVGVIQAST